METNSIPPVPRTCRTDIPIGIAIIVLALLSNVFTFTLGWTAIIVSTIFQQPMRGPMGMREEPSVDPVQIILALMVFVSVLFAVIGFGICKGKGWAFDAAIVMFLLLALGGSGLCAVSILLVIYCIVRRLGILQPTP